MHYDGSKYHVVQAADQRVENNSHVSRFKRTSSFYKDIYTILSESQ